jgi:RNA polymerase sigma factor (sigma-70 family)
MMTTKIMPATANNDAELVAGTLAGNRDAFSQIVARYQSLICSLAYSATGSLGQSEDLAQETFITAWKQLGHLREHDKLRSWLCGIARNRINNFLRREGREPNHQAEPIEEAIESHSPEPLPVEHTISNEEQAILWRSLERIPELYREPLVLFYREHQSIEAVAEKLELTEDNVKQRLSRGRKLLHEEVLAFVEGALAKTSPGKTFTLGVLAALPLAVTSAKAATVGAALAKGGAAAKGVATIGTLGGIFALLGGMYISFKANADDSKSPRERQFMMQWHGKRIFLTLATVASFFAAWQSNYFHAPLHSDYLTAAFLFIVGAYGTAQFTHHCRRRMQIQIEDNTFVEAEWTQPRKITDASGYDSRGTIRSKGARFMAFGIGMTVFVMSQESWKKHLGHALLMTAYFIAALLWGFLQWRNRPRFQSPRASWAVLPLLLGSATLFYFNFHQYEAQLGANMASIATPVEIWVFNIVTVLAYGVLIGTLVWKGRRNYVQGHWNET